MKIIKIILVWLISWFISALLLLPCFLIDLIYKFKIDSHHLFHLWWYDFILQNKPKNNYFIKNEINLNDTITVQLTDYGKELLIKNINKTFILEEYKNDAINSYKKEDDFYELQLWDFMNMFGQHMFNGCKQIVVNNKIKFN